MASSKQWNVLDYSGIESYVKDSLKNLWAVAREKEYNKHPEKRPFTIEATEDGTTIYFRQSGYAVDDGLDALTVEVSTDNGETWRRVTASSQGDGATLATLDAGETALIRGNNSAYGYYSENADGYVENCNFYSGQPCYVYGNIMSLIGGDDFAGLRSVTEYAFAYFFSDYDGEFDYSWVLSKQGTALLLPATTLADECYYSMFKNCTGLTSAPTLPATTLANYCYSSMFNGCTSLTTAPELPATTLADGCYDSMFQDCTSLTSAPALPATTLKNSCYGNMFLDCTSLTTAPTLPATTLVSNCYLYMFNCCSSLTYIKALFTTTPGNSTTLNWVRGVSSNGTFVKSSAATWNVTGDNGVPTGWTVETE